MSRSITSRLEALERHVDPASSAADRRRTERIRRLLIEDEGFTADELDAEVARFAEDPDRRFAELEAEGINRQWLMAEVQSLVEKADECYGTG